MNTRLYSLSKQLGTGLLALSFATAALAASVQPPWSEARPDGYAFHVPGIDNAPDLHGDVNDPQLVIFFAGNQYMVVNELLQAFKKAHPDYQRVFAETLPPGKLVNQIENGALVFGNMRIHLKPDIFTAGSGRVEDLQKQRGWFAETRPYARNRLAIMTYKGNPYEVENWEDLAQAGLSVCMPDPEFEGIAEHAIIPALEEAGGKALVSEIYQDKVNDGSAFKTVIHHRQTPLRIMQKKCDAGAVWYTEAKFHGQMKNHAISLVEIPDTENKTATYVAARMKDAPHEEAAKAFMDFLTGLEGQKIYSKYGFMPPDAAAKKDDRQNSE
nr:substrate-binding domain-containing protein [uncultured Halomonas sp.]